MNVLIVVLLAGLLAAIGGFIALAVDRRQQRQRKTGSSH
jgi:hypothetical protein